MLNEMPTIRKYLTLALPSIIIIVAFYILTPSDFSRDAQKEIKALKKQNDSLAIANGTLHNMIKTYQEDNRKLDEIIQTLYAEDTKVKNQLDSVNNKLKILKQRYDEAKNHADKFSSDDIKRYFSNF